MADIDLFEDREEDSHRENLEPIDPDRNYYEDLVGEDRKYKDEAALARAVVEKDNFIERLKQETAGLREQLNTSTNLEQFLDRLDKREKGSVEEAEGDRDHPGETRRNSSLSIEDIDKLIESKVSEREQKRIQLSNLELVKQELQKNLGSKYVEQLEEVGKSLDMSQEEINNLAMTKPKVLLSLVNAKAGNQASRQEGSLFAAPQGRSTPLDDKPVRRTQSYYNSIKAKDPSTYWSPRIQNQMHNDALQMGDSFFDT